MNEFKLADIRKSFKAIGYKLSIKNHPIIEAGCVISAKSIVDGDVLSFNRSNVIGAETYAKHKAAFELAQQFVGQWVIERHQKIIY